MPPATPSAPRGWFSTVGRKHAALTNEKRDVLSGIVIIRRSMDSSLGG